MTTVISADGTPIAFDRSGSGPPLILVLGAFNERSAGEPLAAWLAPHFSVVNYDRRGRGASGDTQPYAVDREVEDLAALIEAVGGSAAVFGYSSGAVLVMLAAAKGLSISRLALYDPPHPLDGMSPGFFDGLAGDLRSLLERGERSTAVELFQTRAVGIPPEVVAQLRHAPFWSSLERMAHTLEYESMILGADHDLATRVSTPTLVIAGSGSPPPIIGAAEVLADRLPSGALRLLEGETHDIVAESVGPVIVEFLARPES